MELLLGGVEGEVPDIESSRGAEPLVKLLLGAFEAAVTVGRELRVELLKKKGVERGGGGRARARKRSREVSFFFVQQHRLAFEPLFSLSFSFSAHSGIVHDAIYGTRTSRGHPEAGRAQERQREVGIVIAAVAVPNQSCLPLFLLLSLLLSSSSSSSSRTLSSRDIVARRRSGAEKWGRTCFFSPEQLLSKREEPKRRPISTKKSEIKK